MPRTATAHPRWRGILVGAHGLRSGWAVLMFFLITIATMALLLRLTMHPKPLGKNELPLSMGMREALYVVSVTVATWQMARIDGRAITDFGWAKRRAIPDLAAGFIAGLEAISFEVGVLWWLGDYRVVVALPGTAALGFGAGWLLVLVMASFFEESMLRGYPLFRLAEAIGFWRAALIVSLVFGAMHVRNTGESAAGIAAAFVGALAFSLLVRLTGTLWAAIGVHAGWNWAQSFLWGTPVSGLAMQGHWLTTTATGPRLLTGGATGPEASLLVIPALALAVGLAAGLGRAGAVRRRNVLPMRTTGST